MAGTEANKNGSLSDTAKDAGDKAYSAAQDVGRRAANTAADYRDAAASTARDLSDKAGEKADDLRDQASSVKDQLKQQAGEQVDQAKDIVSSLANEARSKVAEIVDQQKNAGAEKLSGFSRAAQSAAGELEENNPAVARLMRDAASTVDGLASDLRSTDLSTFVASVSDFARRQPVAFFAASVVAGFALARFVKSEPAAAQTRPTARRVGRR